MRKKLLSLALALVMCLSLVPSAFAAEKPGSTAVGGFTDVKADDYFAEPVLWAVEKKITAGTSATTFSPNENCTVAQILTFLWRANSSPKPTRSNPFTDVKSGDYYAEAAAWAYEKGMVSGSTFGGNAPCTRSMAVTYMWKAAGSPAPAGKASFTDVPAGADYASAVAWAVEQGVTAGTSATAFSPDNVCTRSQIVTFLYRGLAKATGLGTEPPLVERPVVTESPVGTNEFDLTTVNVSVQKSDTAEGAAKKVHDALWAAGAINSNMTQKEKAWVYLRWLVYVCEYDFSFSAANVHTAYGALVNGLAVCDGYTEAYNLLLGTEGIECSKVISPDHAWTAATLDGILYHIDATNCDCGTAVNPAMFCMTPEISRRIIELDTRLGPMSDEEFMELIDLTYPYCLVFPDGHREYNDWYIN